MATWRQRHRARQRGEWLGKILLAVLLLLAAVGVSTCFFMAVRPAPAHATWKPQYAQAAPEVRDWYEHAELTPEAQKRFPFKSCCKHSDVVRTKFRVDKKNGADQWWYLDGDEYKLIPPDIIHWGEHAPDGQPTLFRLGEGGALTCFWPGADGE